MRWSELSPDGDFLSVLDESDANGSRQDALDSNDQQKKKNWSNRFADSCARLIAREIADHADFGDSEVRPNEHTRAEPVAFLVGGKKKKIDVVVSSLAVGLQLGVSLKGMNFRDRNGLQFDKNLTGRTYELEDELRVVHQTLPMSFMAAIYFLPIAATVDKAGTAPSSFARTVEHLRARVGRADPHSLAQAGRLDMAAVALYVPGDRESFPVQAGGEEAVFSYADDLARGAIRYFNVMEDPPRRGRPIVEKTLDLSELVTFLVDSYRTFTDGVAIEWSEAEPD